MAKHTPCPRCGNRPQRPPTPAAVEKATRVDYSGAVHRVAAGDLPMLTEVAGVVTLLETVPFEEIGRDMETIARARGTHLRLPPVDADWARIGLKLQALIRRERRVGTTEKDGRSIIDRSGFDPTSRQAAKPDLPDPTRQTIRETFLALAGVLVLGLEVVEDRERVFAYIAGASA